MKLLKKTLLSLSALFALAGNVNAFVVSGNFGAHGYATINFSTTGGVVDMVYNGGYGDPTFSLFNGSGAHLISNDDSNGLWSHLTQNLAAGNYSLLVSYCCNVMNAVGWNFASTDGFNSGTYYGIGSGVSLVATKAYLDQSSIASGAAYSVTISNATEGFNNVPEPGSLALLGLGVAALGAASRRKKLDA